jgi:hypothetical protein
LYSTHHAKCDVGVQGLKLCWDTTIQRSSIPQRFHSVIPLLGAGYNYINFNGMHVCRCYKYTKRDSMFRVILNQYRQNEPSLSYMLHVWINLIQLRLFSEGQNSEQQNFNLQTRKAQWACLLSLFSFSCLLSLFFQYPKCWDIRIQSSSIHLRIYYYLVCHKFGHPWTIKVYILSLL